MNILINAIKNSLESTLDRQKVQYVFIGNPEAISKQALNKGVCIIAPDGTDFEVITTGVQINDGKSLRIVFAKSYQNQQNLDAQVEMGTKWLMEVMEGRNEDGTLKTDSGVSIVLSNLRRWGKLQSEVSTNYNTEDITDTPGMTVQGNITITQQDLYSLQLV